METHLADPSTAPARQWQIRCGLIHEGVEKKSLLKRLLKRRCLWDQGTFVDQWSLRLLRSRGYCRESFLCLYQGTLSQVRTELPQANSVRTTPIWIGARYKVGPFGPSVVTSLRSTIDRPRLGRGIAWALSTSGIVETSRIAYSFGQLSPEWHGPKYSQ